MSLQDQIMEEIKTALNSVGVPVIPSYVRDIAAYMQAGAMLGQDTSAEQALRLVEIDAVRKHIDLFHGGRFAKDFNPEITTEESELIVKKKELELERKEQHVQTLKDEEPSRTDPNSEWTKMAVYLSSYYGSGKIPSTFNNLTTEAMKSAYDYAVSNPKQSEGAQ